MKINLADKVGKGYKTFWNFKGRYRVVKGGRGSKKSTTTAQWIIYNMMKYPLANTLVVRQTYNTHLDSTWTQLKWGGRGSKKSTTTAQWIIYNMMKYPLANTLVVRQTYNTHLDSTWTQLKWAAQHLGVAHLWHFSKSPLQATYTPTGQKILFRGLDDPMSITSITVPVGFLCWAWFEEAYQVRSEDAFNKVDMSIRGELPPGYFKQITLTFNPWSDKHWLKRRFFDEKDEDILAITTNYKCNEWLGEDDTKLFEKMKIKYPKRYKVEGLGEWGEKDEDILAITTNYKCNEWLGEDDTKLFEKMKIKYPKRYKVEGLGEWGIIDGLVFENWRVETIDKSKIDGEFIVGLDFGFTNDPTAIISSIVDEENERIYVVNEFFSKGLLNNQILDLLMTQLLLLVLLLMKKMKEFML